MGRPDQFSECFSVFFGIFRRFFQGTVCLSSCVFPRAFFQRFFSEELEAFCCRLTLLPDSHVLARSFFSSFSMTVKRPTFYKKQPVAGLASDAFYGSSSIFGDSVAVSAVASGHSTSL